jgi:hypothetical protein
LDQTLNDEMIDVPLREFREPLKDLCFFPVFLPLVAIFVVDYHPLSLLTSDWVSFWFISTFLMKKPISDPVRLGRKAESCGSLSSEL